MLGLRACAPSLQGLTQSLLSWKDAERRPCHCWGQLKAWFATLVILCIPNPREGEARGRKWEAVLSAGCEATSSCPALVLLGGGLGVWQGPVHRGRAAPRPVLEVDPEVEWCSCTTGHPLWPRCFFRGDGHWLPKHEARCVLINRRDCDTGNRQGQEIRISCAWFLSRQDRAGRLAAASGEVTPASQASTPLASKRRQ